MSYENKRIISACTWHLSEPLSCDQVRGLPSQVSVSGDPGAARTLTRR
jgi:hypothetical protein